MTEISNDLISHIKTLGFKGSATNFRRFGNECIFVINIQMYRPAQRSTVSGKFFINLGGQPLCIPAEGGADLRKLKEYQCVMRRRIGQEWSLHMADGQLLELKTFLNAELNEFVRTLEGLPSAIRSYSVDELLDNFSIGLPHARAALHLARAANFLGCQDIANQLINRGFELAGERATMLIAELNSLRQSLPLNITS